MNWDRWITDEFMIYQEDEDLFVLFNRDDNPAVDAGFSSHSTLANAMSGAERVRSWRRDQEMEGALITDLMQSELRPSEHRPPADPNDVFGPVIHPKA